MLVLTLSDGGVSYQNVYLLYMLTIMDHTYYVNIAYRAGLENEI